MSDYAPWLREEPKQPPLERAYIEVEIPRPPPPKDDEDDPDRGTFTVQVFGDDD